MVAGDCLSKKLDGRVGDNGNAVRRRQEVAHVLVMVGEPQIILAPSFWRRCHYEKEACLRISSSTTASSMTSNLFLCPFGWCSKYNEWWDTFRSASIHLPYLGWKKPPFFVYVPLVGWLMKPAQVPLNCVGHSLGQRFPAFHTGQSQFQIGQSRRNGTGKISLGGYVFWSVSFINCPIHYGIFFGGKPAKHQAEKGQTAR